MFGRKPLLNTQTVGFLLTPNFSMIAFSAAIEPLRSANRLTMKKLYDWSLFTIDGAPVRASNDIEINPNGKLSKNNKLDVLFVCSGVRTYDHLNKKTSNVLRALARKGTHLGSVCTGSATLAEAGLLDGYRCTIHWENIESLAERYSKLDITSTLFETDRNRFTCSGGLAAMDMMIHSIKLDHRRELAMKVADQMPYSASRSPTDMQRMEISRRTGITHPKVLATIGYMEAQIEQPASIAKLANSVGLSIRQMERLFKSELATSPALFYKELRLEKARNLLRQTMLSIQEVAVATGFNTASYFTKSYRTQYGHTPLQERENA